LLEDGTIISIGLVFVSSALIFIGTGYIALDTGFSFSKEWLSTLDQPNQAYALYTLYLLAPLIFISLFFIFETYLVLRVLGETRPLSMFTSKSHPLLKLTCALVWLAGGALIFAIGQIFQFIASVHICNGTSGKINGGMFEVLFTLISVVLIWIFWSSITEDDWPSQGYA
jgi:hypothetical protein